MKIDPALKQDLKNYIRDRLSNKSGKAYVTVVAPYEIGQQELDLLKKKIHLLENAHITVEVDKSIMAGVVIKYGSRMIDLSLRSELQKLQHTLYETA